MGAVKRTHRTAVIRQQIRKLLRKMKCLYTARIKYFSALEDQIINGTPRYDEHHHAIEPVGMMFPVEIRNELTDGAVYDPGDHVANLHVDHVIPRAEFDAMQARWNSREWSDAIVKAVEKATRKTDGGEKDG